MPSIANRHSPCQILRRYSGLRTQIFAPMDLSCIQRRCWAASWKKFMIGSCGIFWSIASPKPVPIPTPTSRALKSYRFFCSCQQTRGCWISIFFICYAFSMEGKMPNSRNRPCVGLVTLPVLASFFIGFGSWMLPRTPGTLGRGGEHNFRNC